MMQLGWFRTLAALGAGVALTLALAQNAVAQPAVPVAAETAGSVQAAPAAFPLKFENHTLFVFRAGIGSYTPAERRDGAVERLRGIAAAGGKLAVTVNTQPEGNFVLVDGKTAFLIVPGDVDLAAGETLESLTEETVKRLEGAALAFHDQRDLGFMLKAAALAAVATLVYAALLRAIFVANRWLGRHLSAAVEKGVGRIKGEIASALNPAAFAGLARSVFSLFSWALGLFAAYVWLAYVLERFPYTRPWGEHLESWLLGTLARIALAIAEAIPGLLVVVIIVVLTRVAVQLASGVFDRVQSGRISVGFIDPHTAPMTRRLVTAVLWLFALAMAYPYLPGAQTEAFRGVSVLLGLMVSLGASSIVAQAASGLILTYSHAFQPGEYVRIGDTEGTLTGVGMFATRMETGLGEQVMLPNSYVLANSTKNYSRSAQGTGFVLDTTVTIGYATPWRQVHAMLQEAARRTAGILADPPPFVVQTALSDFYVEYRLVCYASPQAPRKRATLLSDLHAGIQDVFNEYGVQIMSPHYVTDPPEAQIVPKAKWFPPPARAPGESGGNG